MILVLGSVGFASSMSVWFSWIVFTVAEDVNREHVCT